MCICVQAAGLAAAVHRVRPAAPRAHTCSAPACMMSLHSMPELRTRLPSAPAALARVRSSSSRSSATSGGTAGRSAGYRLALWKPGGPGGQGGVGGRVAGGAAFPPPQLPPRLPPQPRACVPTPMPTCVANGEAGKLAGGAVGVSAQLDQRRHHAVLRQVGVEAVAAGSGEGRRGQVRRPLVSRCAQSRLCSSASPW